LYTSGDDKDKENKAPKVKGINLQSYNIGEI